MINIYSRHSFDILSTTYIQQHTIYITYITINTTTIITTIITINIIINIITWTDTLESRLSFDRLLSLFTAGPRPRTRWQAEARVSKWTHTRPRHTYTTPTPTTSQVIRQWVGLIVYLRLGEGMGGRGQRSRVSSWPLGVTWLTWCCLEVYAWQWWWLSAASHRGVSIHYFQLGRCGGGGPASNSVTPSGTHARNPSSPVLKVLSVQSVMQLTSLHLFWEWIKYFWPFMC